jgi:hypothetical protein
MKMEELTCLGKKKRRRILSKTGHGRRQTGSGKMKFKNEKEKNEVIKRKVEVELKRVEKFGSPTWLP